MQVSGPYLTSNYSQCWTQDESFIITPHGWLWCITESLLYPLGRQQCWAFASGLRNQIKVELQSHLPNLGLATRPLNTSPMNSNPSYPTLDFLHSPSTPHFLWVPIPVIQPWTCYTALLHLASYEFQPVTQPWTCYTAPLHLTSYEFLLPKSIYELLSTWLEKNQKMRRIETIMHAQWWLVTWGIFVSTWVNISHGKATLLRHLQKAKPLFRGQGHTPSPGLDLVCIWVCTQLLDYPWFCGVHCLSELIPLPKKKTCIFKADGGGDRVG